MSRNSGQTSTRAAPGSHRTHVTPTRGPTRASSARSQRERAGTPHRGRRRQKQTDDRLASLLIGELGRGNGAATRRCCFLRVLYIQRLLTSCFGFHMSRIEGSDFRATSEHRSQFQLLNFRIPIQSQAKTLTSHHTHIQKRKASAPEKQSLPPAISETAGPIFKIQEFHSPAGELTSNPISLTSVQTMTSQLSSKVRFLNLQAFRHVNALYLFICQDLFGRGDIPILCPPPPDMGSKSTLPCNISKNIGYKKTRLRRNALQ